MNMNKQIFNKISGKFEYQHISTAEALAKKGKADILKDDATLEVVILRDCHIENKHRRVGDKFTLSVVDAHKWADHGYVKIQGKPKAAKDEKQELDNKLEKAETEIKDEKTKEYDIAEKKYDARIKELESLGLSLPEGYTGDIGTMNAMQWGKLKKSLIK